MQCRATLLRRRTQTASKAEQRSSLRRQRQRQLQLLSVTLNFGQPDSQPAALHTTTGHCSSASSASDNWQATTAAVQSNAIITHTQLATPPICTHTHTHRLKPSAPSLGSRHQNLIHLNFYYNRRTDLQQTLATVALHVTHSLNSPPTAKHKTKHNSNPIYTSRRLRALRNCLVRPQFGQSCDVAAVVVVFVDTLASFRLVTLASNSPM